MGTIIKRGKSYQVQISMYKNGINRRITQTFKTKAEAIYWEREMELMKGNGTQLAYLTTPFPKFYKEWIYFVKKNAVRESTYQNYKQTINTIDELFNNIQMRNINDIVVQRKIDEYASERSKRTVQDLLTKIKSALRYAHSRGYITRDFTRILKAKGTETPNRNKALSIQEFRTLRNYLLQNTDKEINIFFYTILETGLRRGEALGIRPEYLHPDKIQVRESISPTSNDTMLKNKSSKRDIAISKQLYLLLKTIPVKSNGYIFEHTFKQSQQLSTILKILGITETTLHGLRSTHASAIYTNSKNDLYIANRLGHNNTKTTHEYYLHLTPETKKQEDQTTLQYIHNL